MGTAIVKAPDRARLKRKLALVHRRIGEIALRLDGVNFTKDAYQKALTFAPEDLEIRLRLATLLAGEDDLKAATRQLRQLQRRHPNDARVLELEITLGLKSEDYQKALNSCVEILKVDPKHQKSLELLESLGNEQIQELFQRNRYRQAIRLLQSFIEVHPTYTAFYMQLGAVFLEQNRTAEGERVLAKAIEIAENKAEVHAQVGAAYLSATHSDRAESHFEAAGGLDAEPEVLLIIGTAYTAYDAQEADRYFNRLIAVNPEDDKVFEDIAQAFLMSDMTEAAREMLNRGLKEFPDSIRLHTGLVRVDVVLENYASARTNLKKTRQLAQDAGDFEALRAVSALQLMLTFQDTGGFIDEFKDTGRPIFGKPF